jgi:predicted aspartyl protease
MIWRACIPLLAAALASAQCTPEQVDRAAALLERHDLAGAETIAKACDSGGPRSLPFKVILGDIALRRGKVEEAERQFRDAIAINPNSARAWFGLGYVSECTFNRKTAHDCFRKAHELAPNAAPAVLHWAMTLEGPEQSAALETYLDLAKNDAPHGAQQARALIEIQRALGGRKQFGLVSRYARAEIRLEPVMRGRELHAYRLPVSINGGEPVRLLLDTGASGIVINANLAARSHMKRLAAKTVGGLGDTGDVPGFVAVAERVRVGGVEFRDAVVTVSESSSVVGEQGLLGTDIFEQFLVTLDLPNAVLRLEPFPGPGDDRPADRGYQSDPEFDRIYRIGHNLLVPTSVSGADPAMFILDTGASQTLIARDFAAELARMRSAANMPLHGISGRIDNVDAADDLKFKFGGFSVRCLDTLSVSLKRHGDDMGMEVAGFLGFPILKMFSITIDYRNGLMKFECPTAVGRGTPR